MYLNSQIKIKRYVSRFQKYFKIFTYPCTWILKNISKSVMFINMPKYMVWMLKKVQKFVNTFIMFKIKLSYSTMPKNKLRYLKCTKMYPSTKVYICKCIYRFSGYGCLIAFQVSKNIVLAFWISMWFFELEIS